MATLRGLEGVGFELILTGKRTEGSQEWLDYSLILHINTESKIFQNQAGSEQLFGKFSFNLSERDELEALHKQIIKFIQTPSQSIMFFEPADPCFELQIHRTTHSSDEYKIYLWIDAGNSTRLEYSWDAQGIRFLASQEQVLDFCKSLSMQA